MNLESGGLLVSSVLVRFAELRSVLACASKKKSYLCDKQCSNIQTNRQK